MLTLGARGADGGDFAGRTILQLLPRLEAGGLGRAVIAVAQGVVEAGGRALVACEGAGLAPELQAVGAEARDLPLDTANPLRMWFNARRIVRLARAEAVGLIHARARGPAWSALGASRRLGCPLATGWTNQASGTTRSQSYDAVISEGGRILAANRQERGLIEARFPLAAGRVRIVGRAIDLSGHDPALIAPARIAAMRGGWPAPEERPVMLAAFRKETAGAAEAIEAALESARAHGAPEVLILDTASLTDLPAALLAASGLIVAAPAPDRGERLVAEAQALGTPVIVLGAGAASEALFAPPEATAPERTGWRVASGEAESLALALTELLSLRASQRGELAERARRRALDHFGMRRHVAETLAAYAELFETR
jgi:hypothetical protein